MLKPIFIASMLSALAAPQLAQAEIRYSVDLSFTQAPGNRANLAGNGDIVGGITQTDAYTKSLYFYDATSKLTSTVTKTSYHLTNLAINDNGLVLGVQSQIGSSATQYFVYDNSTGSFSYLPSSFFARDINDAGVIVGSYNGKAASFSNGVITTLNLPGGGSANLNVIGNDGSAAGTYAGNYYGFTSKNGSINTSSLNQGSEQYLQPNGISNNGIVVGSQLDSSYQGVSGWVLQNGTLTYIPGLHDYHDGRTWTEGYAANSSGLVAGTAWTGITELDGVYAHAILFEHGHTTDLNTLIDPSLGIILTEATGLNDKGQILASACSISAWSCDTVLLTPMAAVPEPATYAMLLGGLSVVGVFTRRQRRRARQQSAA